MISFADKLLALVGKTPGATDRDLADILVGLSWRSLSAEIARRSQLTREASHCMLSGTGNPELKSLTAVLAAAGLRLAVKPMAAAKARRGLRKHPVAA